MSYDLDIILPSYNPPDGFVQKLEERLSAIQSAYPGKKLHPVVVNDGSTRNFGPETTEALRTAIPGIEIANLERNSGKGAAVRAGIALAKAPYSIYTDIDMPYSIESMCKVIDLVFEGWDVVIAVRDTGYYSKLSPLRKFLSYGSHFMNRVFLGTAHVDTQGGLKGLSPEARKIMLRTRIDDFVFDTEFVTLAARTKGVTIIDVETSLREGVQMSKMSFGVMFRELWNFFRIVTRL